MPNFENSDYRFQPFSCGIDYCLQPFKCDRIGYNSLEFVSYHNIRAPSSCGISCNYPFGLQSFTKPDMDLQTDATRYIYWFNKRQIDATLTSSCEAISGNVKLLNLDGNLWIVRLLLVDCSNTRQSKVQVFSRYPRLQSIVKSPLLFL